MRMIVLAFIGAFLFFVLLHIVIRSAIDRSAMARDIAEIKRLLENNGSGPPNGPRGGEWPPDNNGSDMMQNRV